MLPKRNLGKAAWKSTLTLDERDCYNQQWRLPHGCFVAFFFSAHCLLETFQFFLPLPPQPPFPRPPVFAEATKGRPVPLAFSGASRRSKHLAAKLKQHLWQIMKNKSLVKSSLTILTVNMVLFPMIAWAQIKVGNKYDNITTKNGSSYKDLSILEFDSSKVKFMHSEGVKTLYLNEIDSDSITKLGLKSIDSIEADETDNAPQEKNSNTVERLLNQWATDGQAFKPGDYRIGQIPVGTYVWLKPLENGHSFQENGPDENLVTLENFDSFGYIHVNGIGNISTQGWLIKPPTILKSEYRSALRFYIAHRDLKSYNFSGMYHVGTDIQPGIYVFKKVGSDSGWVREWHGGPPGKGENKLNQVKGEAEYTLIGGMFIDVEDCFISRK